jgi:hypothetical protein
MLKEHMRNSCSENASIHIKIWLRLEGCLLGMQDSSYRRQYIISLWRLFAEAMIPFAISSCPYSLK